MIYILSGNIFFSFSILLSRCLVIDKCLWLGRLNVGWLGIFLTEDGNHVDDTAILLEGWGNIKREEEVFPVETEAVEVCAEENHGSPLDDAQLSRGIGLIRVDDVGGDFNEEGYRQDADDDLGPERGRRDNFRIIFSEAIVGKGDENHIEPEKEEEYDGAGRVEGVVHLASINRVDGELEEDLSNTGHPDNPGWDLNFAVGDLVRVRGQHVIRSLPEKLHEDTGGREDEPEKDILRVVRCCLGYGAIGEWLHLSARDCHEVAEEADNKDDGRHVFSNRSDSKPVDDIVWLVLELD